MTANNVMVLLELVQFGNCEMIPLLSFTQANQQSTFYSSHIHSPDEPPALQVLLDDLHGDPFVEADLILSLTRVWLYRHIFLLWI